MILRLAFYRFLFISVLYGLIVGVGLLLGGGLSRDAPFLSEWVRILCEPEALALYGFVLVCYVGNTFVSKRWASAASPVVETEPLPSYGANGLVLHNGLDAYGNVGGIPVPDSIVDSPRSDE